VADEISLLSNRAREYFAITNRMRGRHAIMVHRHNRRSPRDLPRIAGNRRGKFAARRSGTGFRQLPGSADRKGAPRPEVERRTANRQLQRAGREARLEAAIERLPKCADGLIAPCAPPGCTSKHVTVAAWI